MRTKSTLQLAYEAKQFKEHVVDTIKSTMKNYDLTEQLLIYTDRLTSPNAGYFDKTLEFDTLDEMLEFYNPSEHAFIIHEGLYCLGVVLKESHECRSNLIIDCYNHAQILNSL